MLLFFFCSGRHWPCQVDAGGYILYSCSKSCCNGCAKTLRPRFAFAFLWLKKKEINFLSACRFGKAFDCFPYFCTNEFAAAVCILRHLYILYTHKILRCGGQVCVACLFNCILLRLNTNYDEPTRNHQQWKKSHCTKSEYIFNNPPTNTQHTVTFKSDYYLFSVPYSKVLELFSVAKHLQHFANACCINCICILYMWK